MTDAEISGFGVKSAAWMKAKREREAAQQAAQFGPKDAVVFSDYEAWAAAVKAKGLVLVPCSNGLVAQTGPRGTGKGFWGRHASRGWLEQDAPDADAKAIHHFISCG
jgi:hypothetical protein